MASNNQKIPRTPNEHKNAKDYATIPIGASSIHGYTGMSSGSEITWPQYLLLNAYHPEMKPGAILVDDIRIMGTEADWSEAKDLLNSDVYFQALLEFISSKKKLVELDRKSVEWIGEYAPVFRYLEDVPVGSEKHIDEADKQQVSTAQAERNLWPASWGNVQHNTRQSARLSIGSSTEGFVSYESFRKPDKTKAQDEQTVNAMVISFLKELSSLVCKDPTTWTIERVGLTTSFKGENYTAETDGVFWNRSNKVIKAIVETKREKRGNIYKAVCMQETAEMAAWFSSMPDSQCLKDNRRMLISGDSDECFITIATPGRYYVQYLTDGHMAQGRREYYLEMQTYGPYSMRNAVHVMQFATIIVVFSMLAEKAFGTGSMQQQQQQQPAA